MREVNYIIGGWHAQHDGRSIIPVDVETGEPLSNVRDVTLNESVDGIRTMTVVFLVPAQTSIVDSRPSATGFFRVWSEEDGKWIPRAFGLKGTCNDKPV